MRKSWNFVERKLFRHFRVKSESQANRTFSEECYTVLFHNPIIVYKLRRESDGEKERKRKNERRK